MRKIEVFLSSRAKRNSSLSSRTDPISSPPVVFMSSSTRSKTPHDVYVYPVQTSTPAQQPIHARQSPSFDMNDWLHHGTHSNNDPRPDSATSSVLSRDSGVARSDPKSSRDFSAKSESSSRSPFNPNSNTLMSNGFLTKYGRNGLPNMTRAYPSQPAAATSEINVEQLREKLQPLNTQRLKTLRQATKSFIVKWIFSCRTRRKQRLFSR